MSAAAGDGGAVDRATHEANRHSWNEATAAHESHKAGQAEWLLAGGTTLFPEELRLLGDVRGKRLAHLLCNAGADTVSLALRGAEATGVDIGDVAIDAARALAAACGARVRFERADVYDWLRKEAARGAEYDLVFCSYGALCWLSDLDAWARGVAAVLAPSGRFVCVEFHPLAGMFDEQWNFVHPYFGTGRAVQTEGVPDYVAQAGEGLVPWSGQPGVRDFVNPFPDFTWPWSMGQVVTALLAVGLRIEALDEFPYSNGAVIGEGMRDLGGRRYAAPEQIGDVPLMYAVAARRP